MVVAATEIPTIASSLYDATDHIVGQEKARKQMAVLLDRQVGVVHGLYGRASGAIVAGWTGSGKTMLAEAMCQLSGLPFVSVNATQYTEVGYAGLDLKQMFLPLIEAAARSYDYGRELAPYHVEPRHVGASVLKRPPDELKEIVELAQTGVILLDEFDKWCHRQNHATGRMDTAIQADLLKMVEGSIEYVTDDEDEVGIPFNTNRVLILCAGAFVGLARHAAKRLDLEAGYDRDPTFWDKIEPSDFVRYGLIPELAGRLSTHIFTRPLQAHHLAEIMQQPGGIIHEYKERFEEELNCEWKVEEAAIRQLAAAALEMDTGARGVEHICWQRFSEALFDASITHGPTQVHLNVNEPRARVSKL